MGRPSGVLFQFVPEPFKIPGLAFSDSVMRGFLSTKIAKVLILTNFVEKCNV